MACSTKAGWSPRQVRRAQPQHLAGRPEPGPTREVLGEQRLDAHRIGAVGTLDIGG
jgi:hypothetical protein